jgi:hypothetical protein
VLAKLTKKLHRLFLSYLREVKNKQKFCYPIVKPPEFLQNSENPFTLSTEKG